jgi:cytochrome c
VRKSTLSAPGAGVQYVVGFAVLGWLVSSGASAIAAAQPAQADLRHGERVYASCLACHTLEHNSVGPRHCGLFGRRAGTVAGFDYSPAMKRSGIVWNERTLDRFLVEPMKALPGTAMTFAGVPDARERADLIAWLKQASGSSSKACGGVR